MENKRGTKCSRSPSKEGSPSPSDTKTPLSVPSESPPPPRSSSEISSRRPCSPVFEQGGPSRKARVVDLSSYSDEECLIADVSWDEEFIRRLFGDLNRDVLGPLCDSNIIILSDSDEKENEVHEEKTTGTEDVATFAVVKPTSAASADTDDAPTGVKNDNSDDRTPDEETDGNSGNGDDVRLP
jgi:hypothetical protein